MKKIFNLFQSMVFTLAATTLMVGCSEDAMDSVNKNTNEPLTADAKFMVADLATATAVSVAGGDFNTYAAVAIEHEGGVFNQLYNAERRTGEWTASSTFNNAWNATYANLNSALKVVEKTEDDAEGSDAGNAGIRGIAKVYVVYNTAILTDLFGDIPYTEAFKGSDLMTPKIDKQEDIYKSIMETLDEAIADLKSTSDAGLGRYDFIYGGKTANWLKFAYGLKARLLLHTIFRASDKNAVYQQIVECCNNSFESPDEQAAYNTYDANNWNPTFDLQYSRDYFGVSESMCKKLIERNDPRISRILFLPYDAHITPESEDFNPVPNGTPEQAQWYYNYDCYSLAQTASTYLLSYHEVQFIKAEALARLGQEDAAKTCVRNALVAAFANTEASLKSALDNADNTGFWFDDESGDINTPLTEGDAENYFNNTIAPLTGTDLLKEIMVQKYIAFYGANGESTEAYNDIRRLKAMGENFIELANPNNATRFPLRYGYGNSDTTANPNVKAAFGTGQYVYTEPVWWAGGSR